MKICYLDESGDGSCPTSFSIHSNIQPIFSIVGIIVDSAHLKDITLRLIDLKKRFYPKPFAEKGKKHLAVLTEEIKGSVIRKDFRKADKKLWKLHVKFLKQILKILDTFNIRIVSNVYIKSPKTAFDGKKVYTTTVQKICNYFNQYLIECEDSGIIIADSRTPFDNRTVAFSVATQKFKYSGDQYPQIFECPTFGQSEVHAGIQIADIILSAIIVPVSAYTYCLEHYKSVHVSDNYGYIKSHLAPIIRNLTYRYRDNSGKWRGGITVTDMISHKSSSEFFA